jgi:glyoxylase-like metal-dependent hydrolase (beta-lactamase superfamily II)
VVYLPDQAVLFTSDLLFNNEAGFMADGSARGWVQDLQLLENLVVTKVVPGRGDVTDSGGLRRFRMFLQEFLTEVLVHVERGESAPETVRSFRLATDKAPPNFSRYNRENIEWAWRELQQRR